MRCCWAPPEFAAGVAQSGTGNDFGGEPVSLGRDVDLESVGAIVGSPELDEFTHRSSHGAVVNHHSCFGKGGQ